MSESQQSENVQIPGYSFQPLWCERSKADESDGGGGDGGDGDESDGNESDGEKSYAELEEMHGRKHVEDLYRDDPDNAELLEYLCETDGSLSNEDLGLDKDGNRDDDP
jgi:hypothetical protein